MGGFDGVKRNQGRRLSRRSCRCVAVSQIEHDLRGTGIQERTFLSKVRGGPFPRTGIFWNLELVLRTGGRLYIKGGLNGAKL